MTTGYIVKPKRQPSDNNQKAPRQQFLYEQRRHLYVPETLVMGTFFPINGEANRFLVDDYFFTDHSEDLMQVEEQIDQDKFEVVKELSLPQPVLEAIVEQGKSHQALMNKITAQNNSLKRYFI
tara:strand:+ start:678 stop:1046 length:369 start_codon:yes stop_codon:yes gene_type:complete